MTHKFSPRIYPTRFWAGGGPLVSSSSQFIAVSRKQSGWIGNRLMRLLAIFTLLTISMSAVGQTFDTESKYTDSTGKSIIIQNSLPKGMGSLDSTGKLGYTDANGKYFAYVIFWARVINATASPLELTMNFPADFPPPYSYLKLSLPPDTMTLDKISSYNYGVRDLKSFLDTSLNKPTTLRRTINSQEECLFYIVTLSSKPGDVVRAGLVLKENALYYSVRGIDPKLDAALIPCGQIVSKK